MKAQWDREADDKCTFCGQVDTREHQLLECSIAIDLRGEHEHATKKMHDERAEWVYIPLPRQHDMSLLLRAYIKLIKPPIIPSTLRHVDGELLFFTDEGALSQTRAAARLASCSVVQDVAHNEMERRSSAAFLHLPAPKFPSFKVVALGMVYGD